MVSSSSLRFLLTMMLDMTSVGFADNDFPLLNEHLLRSLASVVRTPGGLRKLNAHDCVAGQRRIRRTAFKSTWGHVALYTECITGTSAAERNRCRREHASVDRPTRLSQSSRSLARGHHDGGCALFGERLCRNVMSM